MTILSSAQPARAGLAGTVVLSLLALTGIFLVVVGFLWFSPRSNELRLPGVVEVQEVRLGSKVSGRVVEVLAREGDRVSAQASLVRLALPELEAQRDLLQAKLDAARAEKKKADDGPRPQEKAEAKAALTAAQARLDRVVKGWRDEEVLQAKHELNAAVAELTQADRELARALELLNTGGATRAELDAARGTRDRAAARQAVARTRLEMVTRGSRNEDVAEAVAERERLKARYELLQETRREDRDIAAAQVRQFEAQLREMDAQLAEGTIRAEESCLVEVMSVRRGDLVTAGQPVVRVLRAEDLWVRVYVAEPDLGKIRLGQTVRVSIDAYPGVGFVGEVVQIANNSEFTPRNIQSADQRKHQVFAVKVRVADPRGIFKSGLAAEVVLPLHGVDQ